MVTFIDARPNMLNTQAIYQKRLQKEDNKSFGEYNSNNLASYGPASYVEYNPAKVTLEASFTQEDFSFGAPFTQAGVTFGAPFRQEQATFGATFNGGEKNFEAPFAQGDVTFGAPFDQKQVNFKASFNHEAPFEVGQLKYGPST